VARTPQLNLLLLAIFAPYLQNKASKAKNPLLLAGKKTISKRISIKWLIKALDRQRSPQPRNQILKHHQIGFKQGSNATTRRSI
jgi:hypothetical protein